MEVKKQNPDALFISADKGINVEELKEEKPANLSFRIPWEKNGDSEDFRIDFNITW